MIQQTLSKACPELCGPYLRAPVLSSLDVAGELFGHPAGVAKVHNFAVSMQ